MNFNIITDETLLSLMNEAPENIRYKGPITAFDFETPNTKADRACQIGITRIENERVKQSFEYLIDPETYFDSICIGVHGITPEQVEGCKTFPEVWEEISWLFYNSLVIAHNACFDLNVLKRLFIAYDIDSEPMRYADTLQISRKIFGKQMPNHKLGTLCSELGISLDAHHAGSDSYGCAELYLRMLERNRNLEEFEKTFNF